MLDYAVVSLVDVSKGTARRTAIKVGAGALAGGAGVHHGRKVVDANAAHRADVAFSGDKRLQAEVLAGGRREPSRRALRTINPSVNRWQDKFESVRGIRNASSDAPSGLKRFVAPKKAVASSDKRILQRYVAMSGERKLKRGVALNAAQAKKGTELTHRGMSSWTHRQSGMPDQYAQHASIRARIPGSKWSRDNPDATRPRVVTGVGRAADITNYSDIYRAHNKARGSRRSRELLAESGVVGRVSRKAKPFHRKHWRAGLSAEGE